MALQLQNTAHWLGQIMQQRGLSTPVQVLPVVEEPRTNEPQPTFNHPQTVSQETGDGGRRAEEEEEPEARVHGRKVRELIENDEVDSYSAGTTRRVGSETWEEEGRQERKPRREEESVDQKLQKMREQLLAELGTKDQNQALLPTSSPFSKWVQ